MTSPPYWGLRDYGVEGMIGLEKTFSEHLNALLEIFTEVKRVLRDDGTLWLNYGDAYTGGTRGHGGYGGEKQKTNKGSMESMRFEAWQFFDLPKKSLMQMPARVAIALQEHGWTLRSEIIWHKPNPMPESATDRPTSAHEKIFLFVKTPRYFYDSEAVRTKMSDSTIERYGDNPEEIWRLPSFVNDEGRNTDHKFSGKRKQTVPVGWASNAKYKGQDARHKKRRKPTYNDKGHKRRPTREVSGIRDRDNYDPLPPEARAEHGANLRNVWSVPVFGFSKAHFATFPPALIEPCIKAGTSERGCCPDCGAPWERILRKRVSFLSGSGKAGNPPKGKHAESCHSTSGEYDLRMGPVVQSATVGWRPTCDCYDDRYRAENPPSKNARKRRQREMTPSRWRRVRARPGGDDWPIKPCVVMDPFGGSGTTAMVAVKLKRDAQLIEISGKYAEMARDRIEGEVGALFVDVELGRIIKPRGRFDADMGLK